MKRIRETKILPFLQSCDIEGFYKFSEGDKSIDLTKRKNPCEMETIKNIFQVFNQMNFEGLTLRETTAILHSNYSSVLSKKALEEYSNLLQELLKDQSKDEEIDSAIEEEADEFSFSQQYKNTKECEKLEFKDIKELFVFLLYFKCKSRTASLETSPDDPSVSKDDGYSFMQYKGLEDSLEEFYEAKSLVDDSKNSKDEDRLELAKEKYEKASSKLLGTKYGPIWICFVEKSTKKKQQQNNNNQNNNDNDHCDKSDNDDDDDSDYTEDDDDDDEDDDDVVFIARSTHPIGEDYLKWSKKSRGTASPHEAGKIILKQYIEDLQFYEELRLSKSPKTY